MRYPALARKGFVLPAGKKSSVRIRASGYEGASTGRRMGNWDISASGPNAEDHGSLITLRARTRDAVRNNPWATSGLNSFVANLVGRGIVPRWNLESKELREEIHSLWNDWTAEADADGTQDFYGLQSLVTKTVIHSGEALVRYRPRRLADGLSVPLQLQVLEPDFLDEYKNGPAPNGNTYHQGIEMNGLGQRVAYWLRRYHPGDTSFLSGGRDQSFRVPATQVAHIYRVDRPGQLRGIPWFAPALPAMYFLDKYEDAELDRKQTAAMFAAFITKNTDMMGPGGMVGFGTEDNVDDNDNPVAELEPGMLNYLLPGEDVKFAEPADVGSNYDAWMVRQLQRIASAIGVTYEQLTGDFSRVNFASSRGRAIEFRRLARQIIATIINFQFNQKVAQVWLAMAVASEAVSIPEFATKRRTYIKIEWRPDGWEWSNPKEDIEVAKQAVRAGFRSREQVVAEMGEEDIEDIDQQNADAIERTDNLGIVYDTDPRFTSDAGVTNARPKGSIIPPVDTPDSIEDVEPDPSEQRPPGFPPKKAPANSDQERQQEEKEAARGTR